ncbi:MAG: zinc ribbon domain-containing protein [Eubacteriales bacterium]|nr:zinc ribbon domain-containing protein [Eubacteriales bacterium]
MESKQVICSQCGAMIPPGEARCPYCGSAYAPAAEREYMEKLEQVREDLDRVGEAGAEASHREIRHVSSRVLRILGVTLIIALLLACAAYWHRQRENTENRKEYLWQQTAFSELDQLYEEGEYDAVLEKIHTYEKEGHKIYRWEHLSLFEIYESTIYVDRFLESRAKGLFEEEDAVVLLYDELKFRGIDHQSGVPAADLERIHAMTAPYENDLTEIFRMSEEDLAFFDRRLSESGGYPTFSDCEEYVRNHPEIISN